ncbi:MAG: methionine synthase [Candidatus Thermoplasmatota archaeon]
MIRGMTTTVVGSMPVQPSRAALANSYRTHEDPFISALEESVSIQLSAGVEIVSDGQTRDTMVSLFAKHLRGVRMKERPVVIGDISWKEPITLTDAKHARSLLPRGVMLKGIVTGPCTMAMGMLDQHYHEPAELTMALAHALNLEAKAIERFVDLLQFDEPYLSIEYPEFAREVIAKLRAGLTKPVALHVCGDVSKIFPELAEMPVDILDHECSANPGLVEVIKECAPRQMIGYGCVRSDDPRVESIEEIAARIRRGVEALGSERILIDPDCGLRNLPLESAVGKLRNMVLAREEVRLG